MPLARDTQPANSVSAMDSAAGFTFRRQITRSNNILGSDHIDRPQTLQNNPEELASSRGLASSATGLTADPVKKYGLVADSVGINGSDFKFVMATGLPHKNLATEPRSSPTQDAVSSHRIKSEYSLNPHRHHSRTKVSVFDETTTIDSSLLDDMGDVGEQTITIRQPLNQGIGLHHATQMKDARDKEVRVHNDQDVVAMLTKLNPNGRGQANDQRVFMNSLTDMSAGVFNRSQRRTNDSRATERGLDLFGNIDLPESHSRPHSVPPRSDIHAPVPQKAVAFISSPQYQIESPVFQSDAVSQEESPIDEDPRPNTTQPIKFRTSTQQWMHGNQQSTSNRNKMGQSAYTSRFQQIPKSLHLTSPQGREVSTPESENHGSSESEQSKGVQEAPGRSHHVEQPVLRNPESRKRSLGDAHILDYEEAELTKKTLADLQNTPFTQNPRAASESPRDSNGNHLSLATLVANWPKMTDDALKTFFQHQTDEEWARTGQWFVDAFQTDLKELTGARLERRKVTLEFEHKIRKRQREIEHHGAGLQKELTELQEGGLGLLKDRKIAGGSRSSTPIRPGR